MIYAEINYELGVSLQRLVTSECRVDLGLRYMEVAVKTMRPYFWRNSGHQLAKKAKSLVANDELLVNLLLASAQPFYWYNNL